MNAKLNLTTLCQCGKEKEQGALFCDPCFIALPELMQAEINVRIRDISTTNQQADLWLKIHHLPDDTHDAEYRAEAMDSNRRFADMRDGGISKENGQ